MFAEHGPRAFEIDLLQGLEHALAELLLAVRGPGRLGLRKAVRATGKLGFEGVCLDADDGPKLGAANRVGEHGLPEGFALDEVTAALDALLELKEAGKVRFVGMSGTFPHLTEHIAMGVFEVFQIPYSAVEREHEAAIAGQLEAAGEAATPGAGG